MINDIARCGGVCGEGGCFTSSLAVTVSYKIIKNDGKRDCHSCLLQGQSERPVSTTRLALRRYSALIRFQARQSCKRHSGQIHVAASESSTCT